MEDNAYQRFEELLLDKGVTAYKVSKATGITTTTLTNWKKGKYVPKADKLQLIDDYFGVTLDYLMTGKESNIGSFLLDEMGKEDLTIDEMVDRCGVSKRKFCEIIYKKHKGLYMETFLTICENLHIKYSDIFDIMKKAYK